MIDYDAIARAGGISKGRPRALAKTDRRKDLEDKDEAENVKVRARSKGICEVESPRRCRRRAWQIHHHIGGFGRRARGASALAKNKTHACGTCHLLITSKVLRHITGGQRYRKVT